MCCVSDNNDTATTRTYHICCVVFQIIMIQLQPERTTSNGMYYNLVRPGKVPGGTVTLEPSHQINVVNMVVLLCSHHQFAVDHV